MLSWKKSLLILLLSLTVTLRAYAQSPQPPVPREGAEYHRQEADEHQTPTHANPTPIGRQNQNEPSGHVKDSDKSEPQTIRIVSPFPQLNLIRDWTDYALPFVTLLLVCVTWAQARLAMSVALLELSSGCIVS